MSTIELTVPCFNESRRLPRERFVELALAPPIHLLFIDDGSTDETPSVLRELCAQVPGRARMITLPCNRGKGEAVRTGLIDSIASGAWGVGYLDADLATPVREVLRLAAILDEGVAEVVLGSRVALAGHRIRWQAARHYLGRVFATAASLVLRAQIYDTQCGAKLLRVTPQLEAALSQPFRSRWAFDVELLSRLLADGPGHGTRTSAVILEVPLREWTHVPGSKINTYEMVRATMELLLVELDLRRRRSKPCP